MEHWSITLGPKFLFSCIRICGGVCLSLLPSLAATDSVEAFDGATIALPPFYVEPAGERWTLVAAEDYELLTTHDHTFARQFTRAYFRQSHFVSQLVPPRYLWRPYLPDTFIVTDRDSRRLTKDNMVGQIIAKQKSLHQANERRSRFLPNLRLTSPDSSINFAFFDETDLDQNTSRNRQNHFNDSWHILNQRRDASGFRFSTSRLNQQLSAHAPTLPHWAIVGLVDIYDHTTFTRNQMTVDPLELEVPDPVDASPETAPPLIALEALLGPPMPSGREAQLLWRKHAHLFVRWSLFAEDGKHRDAFWKFIDESEHKSASEVRFRETFGLSFATALEAITQFHPTKGAKKLAVKIASDFHQPKVSITTASRAVISHRLAEWERLETRHMREQHPQWIDTYLSRARQTIASARQNGADSPALSATSGLLEFEANEVDLATRELQAAVDAGVSRPYVLHTLAQLKFDAVLARHSDGLLIPTSQIEPAVALLLRAHQTAPAAAEVYRLLSTIWEASDHPFGTKEMAVLATGVRRFPRNHALVVQLVRMQVRRGDFQNARNVLHFARDRAADTETITVYDKLATTLNDLTENVPQ